MVLKVRAARGARPRTVIIARTRRAGNRTGSTSARAATPTPTRAPTWRSSTRQDREQLEPRRRRARAGVANMVETATLLLRSPS
jgi:hypothetical protein